MRLRARHASPRRLPTVPPALRGVLTGAPDRPGRHAARGGLRAVLLPGLLLAGTGAAAGTPVVPPAPGARQQTVLAAVHAPSTAADLRRPAPDRAPGALPARRPVAPARPARAVRPVATGWISSEFGRRWGRLHAGIDIAVPVGRPVRSVLPGTVEAAGRDGGYGSRVVVRHEGGVRTVYAHLDAVRVRRGPVAAGTVIGRSGNTGHSTGPHLHFEVRVTDRPVDPRPWLRRRGVRL